MDYHRIAEDALCAAAALGARELCRWAWVHFKARRELARLESELGCCPPAEVIWPTEDFEGPDCIS